VLAQLQNKEVELLELNELLEIKEQDFIEIQAEVDLYSSEQAHKEA